MTRTFLPSPSAILGSLSIAALSLALTTPAKAATVFPVDWDGALNAQTTSGTFTGDFNTRTVDVSGAVTNAGGAIRINGNFTGPAFAAAPPHGYYRSDSLSTTEQCDIRS